jgi:hypothetical protein
MMTDRPDHKVNRYPWNRANSTARLHLEAFLTAAERHIRRGDGQALPFPPEAGLRVLAWLLARMDRPPQDG